MGRKPADTIPDPRQSATRLRSLRCIIGASVTRAGHAITLIDTWPAHVDQARAHGLKVAGLRTEVDGLPTSTLRYVPTGQANRTVSVHAVDRSPATPRFAP